MIPVQAAIGGKMVIRRSIKGFKRCFNQNSWRWCNRPKKKIIRKTKKGKARSKQFGKVEIPQKLLLAS